MRVGYMGVGLMGHGAAKNMLLKGHALTVLGNRNRAPVDDLLGRGASEATNPRALAEACDVMFMCLPSTVQVEQAVYGDDGVVHAARPGFVLVDATTSDPLSTRRIGADLRARGADMVDAPMGRTPKEAEAGTLSSFVGGERATLDRVLPLIRCYADTIVEAGPLGSGHAIKLVNNFLAIGTSAIVGEAIAAAMVLGIDLATFKAVVDTGGANSVMFQRFIQWSLTGDDSAFQATMQIGVKDLAYYSKMAAEAGLGTALAEAAARPYELADRLGHGKQFMPVVSAILATQVDGKERPLPQR